MTQQGKKNGSHVTSIQLQGKPIPSKLHHPLVLPGLNFEESALTSGVPLRKSQALDKGMES